MEGTTVYILGAGASVEASPATNGFPDGKNLKRIIAASFAIRLTQSSSDLSDRVMFDALVKLSTDEKGNFSTSKMNDLKDASQQIRNSMPLAPSIDNFVHAHNDNEKLVSCAKIAIVKAILDAERDSLLARSATQDGSFYEKYVSLEETWYAKYFWNLIQGSTLENIADRLSKTKFIIFNYDRCFEHFIYDALKTYFNLTREKTIEILRHLEIFHPYGAIGSLQWQDETNYVDFGVEYIAADLIRMSKKIKTFTEGTGEYSEIKLIRSHVERAMKFIFLGFSFHELNMDILIEDRVNPKDISRRKKCFATAYNLSSADIEQIRRVKLKNIALRESILIHDLTCSELFSHHSIQLSQ